MTTQELMSGLAGCYDTLIFPWHRAVDPKLLEVMRTYGEAGGRVIVDCQFSFCDPHGRLVAREDASTLGQLFGGWVEAVHDGRTGGSVWEGSPVSGFWADLQVNTAEVLSTFEDGRPGVIRHKLGKGEAILMALDPASVAAKPDVAWA